ncbi:MAG TPA: putative metallopeptidase [Alcanivorax sp.]|nr:putative metallopeptidase [Alcanivorax sp.]
MGIEPYRLPPKGKHQPKEIYNRLVKRCPEFEDQREYQPTVGFLMREFPLVEGGRTVLGAMHLPAVQGKLRSLFEWMVERMFGHLPDFIMILDAGYWDSVDAKLREILVFHEMCHMALKINNDGDMVIDDETGRPKWKLVGHDVEEFTAVVARYGAWNDELRRFVEAAGGRAQ